MAIKNKIDSKIGISFDDCYIKIENVIIDIKRERLTVNIEGFANQEARKKNDNENIMRVLKDQKFIKFQDIQIKELKKDEILTKCYEFLQKNYYKGLKI
jgi:hypothetical protein